MYKLIFRIADPTRRSYFSTSLTHDILHNRVAIPFSKYFQFSTTVTRSHPMSLFIPSSTINSRRFSFFINSLFLWNTIPHRILKLTNPVAFRTALRRFLFAYSCNCFVFQSVYSNVIVLCFVFVLLLCVCFLYLYVLYGEHVYRLCLMSLTKIDNLI